MKMKKFLTYLFVIITLLSRYTSTFGDLSSMIIKITKLECLPNPKYITDAKCQLKAINWHKTLANMDCQIINKLEDVSIHFELFQKNSANKFTPWLLNITQNACAVFKTSSFNIYARILKNILAEFSNLNHSCPYTGKLTVKSLSLDMQHLRYIALPFGAYKAVLRFLEGPSYDEIGTVKLYVQVYEQQKKYTKNRETKA